MLPCCHDVLESNASMEFRGVQWDHGNHNDFMEYDGIPCLSSLWALAFWSDPLYAPLKQALQARFTWGGFKDVHSLVHMRCGLVVAFYRNGKRSQARIQYCISCGEVTTDPYVHGFGLQHVMFAMLSRPARPHRNAVYEVLRAYPSSKGFEFAVALCVAIDYAAQAFWKNPGPCMSL